jgi:protease secretion system membrane fusion protein
MPLFPQRVPDNARTVYFLNCRMANSERPSLIPAPASGSVPLSANTGHAARIGLWALGLGFGGFLLWAALAPLDEGVPSLGTVMIDTKRKAVQHLSGGIIHQVMVHEGQHVQEGQPLIKLDAATMRANYESVRQRYLSLRAMQGRLQTEQADKEQIEFHPDLQGAASDPLIQVQMQTQNQLLQTRRFALRAALQAIEESMQNQQGMLETYEGMLVQRRNQLALVQEELKNTRSLVSEGYAPRNRQLELERQVADINASSIELQGNIQRALRTKAELRQQSLLRRQDYRKEVETQLAEVLREVQSDAEKLNAVRADLDRTEIRAPATGQVIGLAVQTVGGVIQPGQKLMDIVPEDEPLLLEARIDPHFIDRVHPGLKTDVRFTAFAHSPQLVVEGELLSLSNDLLNEQVGNSMVSYYLARVKVTPDGMKTLGQRRLQPGMQAEVVIKTGERSMLTYLLNPLTKRLAASMKEE